MPKEHVPASPFEHGAAPLVHSEYGCEDPWPTSETTYTPTYAPAFDTAPTDLESRVGIESLEHLHAERRAIIDKLAPLALLFGSGGDRWDAIRKRHRDGIEKLIQADHVDTIPKGKLEAMANADPRHIAFCEAQERKFVAYMKWQAVLSEVEERIDSRKAELYYTGKEMGLQ